MNFVFILVDDLGKQDMSCEGSTFYETPNIDALARSGMRFSNGYSTCQVCSPSRASIMLGTYPARNKITDWIGAATGKNWRRNDRVLPVEYVHALPKEETTIAEAMRAGGYRTGNTRALRRQFFPVAAPIQSVILFRAGYVPSMMLAREGLHTWHVEYPFENRIPLRASASMFGVS
jgi:hypothetical protein